MKLRKVVDQGIEELEDNDKEWKKRLSEREDQLVKDIKNLEFLLKVLEELANGN